MRRGGHNRKRTRKKHKIAKHRQTNRRRIRRTRRTRRTRRKMKGGAEHSLPQVGTTAAGGEGAAIAASMESNPGGSVVDIKQILECNMQKYSSELGDNDNFGAEIDRSTLICIEKIKQIRPLEESIRSRSIFMTTGFSYCYMFEEFIDEDNIMFCDWGIKTLSDTKKYIKYGIARRNYELRKGSDRGKATIDQVKDEGGIEHWYRVGPLPKKNYIFLHMNLNDNEHITTLLETINRLGCTITTNNLSNVTKYIPEPASEQPYYRFFGDEPAINPKCMYICGLQSYYFDKKNIVDIIAEAARFNQIDIVAWERERDEFGKWIGPEHYDFSGEDALNSNYHWIEFDDLSRQVFQSPDIPQINLDSECG